jgi:hypothetical protein
MAHVANRDINNVNVEIHASPYGAWTIQLPADAEGNHGSSLGSHASSLDAAINLARTEIKRRQVKVSVPFKTAEGKRGIATSRHARSTDKLLTEIEGKKEHIGWRETVFKAETPQSVIDHLKEIDDEQSKLRAERIALVNEWKFDLSKAVDAAIEEKTKEKS